MSTTFRRNGKSINLPDGFSWTTLFFGPVPSMLRGNWAMAFVLVLTDIAGLWLGGWVFHGADAYGCLGVLRILSGLYRNDVLHEHYLEEGWTSKPEPQGLRVLEPANDEWNEDL